MIELERTYLAKSLPAGLKTCRSREIIDIYIPESSDHPKLRLRKSGDDYELTKKEPVDDSDASHQSEQTIRLTEAEFRALSKLEGRKTHKVRYYYEHDGRIAEFDVFQGPLKGLVVVDFEFSHAEEKDAFRMPDFCLADVTQEYFIAGGVICGRKYEDVAHHLDRFGYRKLSIE